MSLGLLGHHSIDLPHTVALSDTSGLVPDHASPPPTSVMDLVGRFMFPTGPLPKLVPHCAPPAQDSGITAGPYHGMLSMKIPKFLSEYLGLPTKGPPQFAKVVSSDSRFVKVPEFQTCSTKGVFAPLPAGMHPVHPSLQFTRPVGRVHVNLTDHDQVLWKSSYDLKGKTFLSTTHVPALAARDTVPDYIPACAVGKESILKLKVDAEKYHVPMKIKFLNPTGGFERSQTLEDRGSARPPDTLVPQHELQTADATVCTIVKKDHVAEKLTDLDSGKRRNVHLPEPWANALWRLDRGREETSDLNPHGMPMMDLAPKGDNHTDVSSPGAGPVLGGQLLARRPFLNAEIQVDQLEDNKFQLFDSRAMSTNLHQVDKSAILTKPPGFVQPAVAKNVYSQMWQGLHDNHPKEVNGTKVWSNLHPSFQFKHPASIAHVTMKAGDKNIWDAVFKVNGAHKIAADQNPVGGLKPIFPGIDPPASKNEMYSIKIDLDNPENTNEQISFWRESEFFFKATRPAVHSELAIRVGSNFLNIF